MRRIVLASAVICGLLAGCATPTEVAGAQTSSFACPPGRIVVGTDTEGRAVCQEPRHAGFLCPSGEAIVGFGHDGIPTCQAFAPPPARPPAPLPPKEATQEISSNLKVINVHGYRNDTTTSEIHKIVVALELSAGAVPLDMSKLIARMSDGTTSYDFDYGWDNAAGFNTTWVRGTNNSAVMQAGDLIQLELMAWPMFAGGIAEREDIKLTLVPETGRLVMADFRTPATYGTDKLITLR